MSAVLQITPRVERHPLTEREHEVVTLVCEGYSCKQIAAELGITYKTADCHRTRIMQKLNIHCVALLVRWACRKGLVIP